VSNLAANIVNDGLWKRTRTIPITNAFSFYKEINMTNRSSMKLLNFMKNGTVRGYNMTNMSHLT